MRNFTVTQALFSSSNQTSEVVDCRDAFDITVSLYTSAGTTSVMTWQVSNWTGRYGVPADGSIPAATWSNWTNFSPSGATAFAPILGVRYARLLKESYVTGVFTVNKTING